MPGKKNKARYINSSEAKNRASVQIPLPILNQTSDRSIQMYPAQAGTVWNRGVLFSNFVSCGDSLDSWIPTDTVNQIRNQVRTRIDGRRVYSETEVKRYLLIALRAWSMIYFWESVDALQNTELYDSSVFHNQYFIGTTQGRVVQSQYDLYMLGATAARFRTACASVFHLPNEVHKLLQRQFGCFLTQPRESGTSHLWVYTPYDAYVQNNTSITGPMSLTNQTNLMNSLLSEVNPEQSQFGIDYRGYLPNSTPMPPVSSIEFDTMSYLRMVNSTSRYVFNGGQMPDSHVPGVFKSFTPILEDEDLIYAVMGTYWRFGGGLNGFCVVRPASLESSTTVYGGIGNNPFYILFGGTQAYSNGSWQIMATDLIDFTLLSWRVDPIYDNMVWTKGPLVWYQHTAGLVGTAADQYQFQNILSQVLNKLFLS